MSGLARNWRARAPAWGPRTGTQLEFGRHLRGSTDLPERADQLDQSPPPAAVQIPDEDLRFQRQTAHVSEENLRWTARARFGTYRFFGFAQTDSDGYAMLTPAGDRFVETTRPGDVLLRQLLKWQYPDYQHHGARYPASDFAIHPFVATARLVGELDGLTREEISLYCFTMRRTEDAAAIAEQVRQFRERRARASGRTGKRRAARDAQTAARARYMVEGVRVVGSTDDYADALIRYFRYTGLFSVRGSRLVVAGGRERDLEELIYTNPSSGSSRGADTRGSLQLTLGEAPPVRLAEPRSLSSDYEDHAAYHAYYGDATAPTLPWEDPARFAALARLLGEQVAMLRAREAHLRTGRSILSGPTLAIGSLSDEGIDRAVDTLRREKQRLERAIFAIESHTPQRLKEALDAYQPILRREVIDPPTSLEWNTWRVFLALGGAREVVPYLQLDDDLQPLNPAQGNQPDMTVDYGDFLVVSEVTLRTGADQRQAEARPVTRHVLDAHRRYNDPFGGRAERPVYGLFIAPRVHPDSANDFFVALKYRVIERQQIAAIPLTVTQFATALRPFAAGVEFQAHTLQRLLAAWVEAGLTAETGDEWLERIDGALRAWLVSLGVSPHAAERAAHAVPLPLF
ncbi:MAG: AlwI family type II restriction endonuclease [Chloroflexota bacterium]